MSKVGQTKSAEKVVFEGRHVNYKVQLDSEYGKARINGNGQDNGPRASLTI